MEGFQSSGSNIRLSFLVVELPIHFLYLIHFLFFHRFRQFSGGSFYRNIDNVAGGGSIHFTPGIVFLETVEGARKETFNINQHRKNEKAIN